MINSNPDTIAVWTDDGRDDSAAEVGVTFVAGVESAGNRIDVEVASGKALTYVLLRWNLDVAPAARVLGDHWERSYGDLEWRGIAAERALPWYALVYDEATDCTVGYGVETGANTFASWRVDYDGVTLILDLHSGGKGVRLGDRTLAAATVRSLESLEGESAFAFARRFCRALCPHPRLPKYTVYGGNDWYHRFGNVSDETVKQDAGIIRDLSPEGDNSPAFVIDAGWFPSESCNGGPYERGKPGFEDMGALAAWMKQQQVRPGIWIRPMLTTDIEHVPASWRMPQEHPLGRQRDAYLDPTVPEVIDFVRTDIRRLTSWGYEVIKHDFTTYDILGTWGFLMGSSVTQGGWSFSDRSRTNAEVIRDLYTAIRDAAGDATLIGCNTVGHLGAGLFELQRTGDDTSGVHWERTRKMGINTLAMRMPQHNAFFCIDADCVCMAGGIPWELNSQWLDLVARSSTPLFVSPNPNEIGPEQRKALKQAFQIAAAPHACAEPLDWLNTTTPRNWISGGEAEARSYNWSAYEGSAFACPG